MKYQVKVVTKGGVKSFERFEGDGARDLAYSYVGLVLSDQSPIKDVQYVKVSIL